MGTACRLKTEAGPSKAMEGLLQKHLSIYWEVLWSSISTRAVQTQASFPTFTPSPLMALVEVSLVTSIATMVRMTNQIVLKWTGSRPMEDVVVPLHCIQSQEPEVVHATIGV